MFSNRIANSAKFLQMPLESQALYFHLIMRADDDGVVEAYPVLKLLSTTPDVFKILLAKGFIRQLNEDQVVLVENWREHNQIRADRKIDSIYKDLIPKEVELLEVKPRSDVTNNTKRLDGPSTDGIGKVSIGKYSLNKRKEFPLIKKEENGKICVLCHKPTSNYRTSSGGVECLEC